MRKYLKRILSILPVLTLTTSVACNKASVDFPIIELENPIIKIETENLQPITSKETYLNATINLFNCDEQQKFINVPCKIRGRGWSSWILPKKSYRLKFNEKTSMLGSSYKAKNWLLIGNHVDNSLYRNFIAYKLASYMQDLPFTPSTNMVDLYLNNIYLGAYLVTDKIEVSKERLNIDDSVDPNANNGFLLEQTSLARARTEGTENVDYFSIDSQQTYDIKSPDTESPEYLAVANVQTAYIKNYFNDCFNALSDQDWTKVKELIDLNSFADGYIMQELFANLDCYRYSMFYYKDKGGKLCNGPVWDFDLSSGNTSQGPGSRETCPPDKILWAANKNIFYKDLLKCDEFKTIVTTKLNNFKPNFEKEMALLDPENPEGYFALHQKSLERNFERWPMIDSWKTTCIPNDVLALKTVKENLSFLKTWLEKRFAYMQTFYK